jgi:hypothetical protein
VRNVHFKPVFSCVGANGGKRLVERGPDRDASAGAEERVSFREATLYLLGEDFMASSRWLAASGFLAASLSLAGDIRYANAEYKVAIHRSRPA